MKKAKYTPGTWKRHHLTIKDPRGMVVAEASEPDRMLKGAERNEDMEWCKGNARLIAAAPELLEALQVCKAALDWVIEQGGGPACEHEGGVVCFCKENNAINVAKVAIAKATGAAT